MTHSESNINSQPMESPGHASPTPIPASSERSSAEIQDWMVSYLARQLNTVRDEIDVKVPFEQYALDSASAIEMTGDLEEWLGRRVDPMLVYDYPTISDMSQYLGGGDAEAGGI
jgi:acyl carrier protein